jgi:adenylate cyclase class IV
MPLEYEYSFYNYNKEHIISKIKSLNYELKGTYLFRVQTFIHPSNKENTYIRVRDEGHRITMTHKLLSINNFDDETEVNVNDFDSAVQLLINIGCIKKYYYEKIREIWVNENVEVIFDTNPGNIEKMEVEATNTADLNIIIKVLGLDYNLKDDSNKYLDMFGIEIPKNIDLKFKTVEKDLLPYVKKNKKDFKELIEKQVRKYNSLII